MVTKIEMFQFAQSPDLTQLDLCLWDWMKSEVYKREGDYLLIPWSRVLLEKLTSFAANQEIPCILWNPKVHYPTHKRPPPVLIMGQLNSPHNSFPLPQDPS